MGKPIRTRTYRKRKRAEAEEETRRRITEAAVELHGTVGPAHTTVTDIAKLAGVSRMTVYNHFPTEVDVGRACSSHWAERNPFPDPAKWTASDPRERLRAALRELYEWYGLQQQMLGNIVRDRAVVPALEEVMEDQWDPWMDAVVAALGLGWVDAGAELHAGIRLAVDFNTWRVLTESGLGDAEAADVMAGMVEST
jgi:AcrR family transcriptional regulator